MQKLTRAEEQLMQIIWKLEKAFLKEIMQELPEPKPKQSTVSTIIKILGDKGFISHNTFGKSHQYYPLVEKDNYAKAYFQQFLGKYFDGSFNRLLSFFHKEGEIDLKDLDEILKKLNKEQDHE
ncbi:MAG: BlaI/MecI/CopY family transcriptional regulator [Bacteroidota bacterium]